MIFKDNNIRPKMAKEDNPDFGEFFKIMQDPEADIFLRFSKSLGKAAKIEKEDYEKFLTFCDAWDANKPVDSK